MSCFIRTALCAGVFLVAAAPVRAQGPSAADIALETEERASLRGSPIRGLVVNATGAPVSDAAVRLVDRGGQILQQTSTSGDGSFVFGEVPAGEYALLAESRDQLSLHQRLQHEDARSDVTLQLGAAGLPGGPVAGTDAQQASAVAAIDQQIVELQSKLADLQDQLNELAKARNAVVGESRKIASAAPLPTLPPAALAPESSAGAIPAPPASASQQAAAPQQQQEERPLPGRGSTEKGLYQGLAAGAPGSRYGRSLFSDFVKIGGYGSFRYEANNIDLGPQVRDLPRLQRGHNAFDFRRFVVTLDAAPFEKLRFYTELEFERLNELEVERNTIPENRGRATRDRRGTRFIQEVEGTSGGEIAMEQAWAEYSFTDNFAARMGVILPPVGRFNILHDDDYWDIPRRPLVDRGGPVLPTKSAWREMGAGVVFNKPVGDGYIDGQFYVVNGVQLDFAMEEVVALREGRNLLELEPELAFTSGAFDGSQTADAFTWRLAASPKLGQEIGISGYHGNYTPDYLIEQAWVNTLAVDGKATIGNFEVEGEFVYTNFNRFREVLNDISLQMVDAVSKTSSSETADLESELEAEFKGPFTKSRKGFWVDFKYRARPKWLQDSSFGRDFEDPQLIPIVRWERIWFDDFLSGFDFVDSQITSLNAENLQQERITFGLAYRPVTSVVFTTAWEHNRRVEGSQLIFPQPVGTDPLFDKSFDTLIFGTAFGF